MDQTSCKSSSDNQKNVQLNVTGNTASPIQQNNKLANIPTQSRSRADNLQEAAEVADIPTQSTSNAGSLPTTSVTRANVDAPSQRSTMLEEQSHEVDVQHAIHETASQLVDRGENVIHVHHYHDQRQFNQNTYSGNPQQLHVGDKYYQQETPAASTPRSCSICGSCDHQDDRCSLVEKLKKTLLERSKEESGKMSYPVKANLQISRVPLQISSHVEKNMKHLDNYGHYNKRSEIDYVTKTVEGNVKLLDIFDRATANAKKESSKQANKTARKTFVDRHGNVVGMIGQAGVGKTTLTRMLLHRIIDSEMLPETQFTFYIPFRNVDYFHETTLMNFALTGCCDWEHDDETDKKLLKMLHDNPNTVFVFDGFDEADTDRLSKDSKRVPSFNLYSKQKPDLFVARILSGELFPKAKKLITSRPRQFFEMHPDYRPRFVLDILGLNEEAQRNLCGQICGELCDGVMSYLKLHPDILACCYIPVNCIITMSILHESLKNHGKIDVISLTDIFIQTLEIFVQSEHVRAHAEEVWKLCKLAWEGFRRKKIIFGESDFKKTKISETVLEAFLCTYVKGEVKGTILQGKKKSSFSHLTWQELFVAIYLALYHPPEEFHELIESGKLNEPMWEVVSTFLFGLCNPHVMERLEDIFSPETSTSWERKKGSLRTSLIQLLQEEGLSSEELFRAIRWIREADDGDLNTTIADLIPKKIKFPKPVLPTDVASAAHVLRLAKKPLDIKFQPHSNIPENMLEYFCNELLSFPVKINSLSLWGNKIGDEGAEHLSTCLRNVNKLDLTNCNITAKGIEAITNQLKTCKINSLDLSSNEIGDIGAKYVSTALANLNDLKLWDCNITSNGVEAIALQLKRCKINSLDLEGNKIGDEGAEHLSTCLSNVNELDLRRCGITAKGIEAITNQLKTCKGTKVKGLELYLQ